MFSVFSLCQYNSLCVDHFIVSVIIFYLCSQIYLLEYTLFQLCAQVYCFGLYYLFQLCSQLLSQSLYFIFALFNCVVVRDIAVFLSVFFRVSILSSGCVHMEDPLYIILVVFTGAFVRVSFLYFTFVHRCIHFLYFILAVYHWCFCQSL